MGAAVSSAFGSFGIALCRHHQLLLMFVHHVHAFLELHHLRRVLAPLCQSGGARRTSRPRVHHCVVCASSGKPMAGGAVSMPWTLVEDCSAPSVDRLGNRKLTLDVVASGTLIALTSQWSASCLSVNHAMFAVECPNHQTSKAKSFGRDGSCCSWFNPNSHHAVMCISSQETTRVDVRANCICAIMRCKMESELKFNAFNPLPHLLAGANVVDT